MFKKMILSLSLSVVLLAGSLQLAFSDDPSCYDTCVQGQDAAIQQCIATHPPGTQALMFCVGTALQYTNTCCSLNCPTGQCP